MRIDIGKVATVDLPYWSKNSTKLFGAKPSVNTVKSKNKMVIRQDSNNFEKLKRETKIGLSCVTLGDLQGSHCYHILSDMIGDPFTWVSYDYETYILLPFCPIVDPVRREVNKEYYILIYRLNSSKIASFVTKVKDCYISDNFSMLIKYWNNDHVQLDIFAEKKTFYVNIGSSHICDDYKGICIKKLFQFECPETINNEIVIEHGKQDVEDGGYHVFFSRTFGSRSIPAKDPTQLIGYDYKWLYDKYQFAKITSDGKEFMIVTYPVDCGAKNNTLYLFKLKDGEVSELIDSVPISPDTMIQHKNFSVQSTVTLNIASKIIVDAYNELKVLY